MSFLRGRGPSLAIPGLSRPDSLRRPAEEIAAMRVAGQVVAEMHVAMRECIKPGVTTLDLDGIARDVLERRGATSNFLGYHGYPAVICASPNDVIIHGIPDDVPLMDGDIVSIDCGAVVDGWHGDAAFTVAVGAATDAAQHLIDVADASLVAAIEQMVHGGRLSDIGHAVQTVAEAGGYEVVREYTGHGIGREMHEQPSVPNYGKPGKGPRMAVGTVLAIEPMLTVGSAETVVLEDRWSVVTADGSPAAHVEHTIAITDNGPEILTL